jgi:hypothetical protein
MCGSEYRPRVPGAGLGAKSPGSDGTPLSIVKRFSITFSVFVLLASSANTPSAQPDVAISGMSGRVSPALKLSLQSGWQTASNLPGKSELRLVAAPGAAGSVDVTLSETGPGGQSLVALPLELRTNEAYVLEVVLISSEGCAPAITASIGSVRATGSAVRPRATEVLIQDASFDLMGGGNPVNVLRGPRISAGGNYTTPGNALSVDLNLSISPNNAAQCSWRVSFRVSLRPS